MLVLCCRLGRVVYAEVEQFMRSRNAPSFLKMPHELALKRAFCYTCLNNDANLHEDDDPLVEVPMPRRAWRPRSPLRSPSFVGAQP